MATDYDAIAREYVEIKKQPWRSFIEGYSFLGQVGDVSGLRVVDLACGSGHYTRMIKARGAAQVLGIDISQAEIDLARKEEEARPLGIEYRVADASADGPQCDFDVAISAYLLPYARNHEELDRFCRGIARYVRPGGRFVTVTANNDVYHYPRGVYDQYPYRVDLEDEVAIGAKILWQSPVDGKMIAIETYYIPHEDYRQALERAGFVDVELIDPDMNRAALSESEQKYWENFVRYPVCLIIDATRARQAT